MQAFYVKDMQLCMPGKSWEKGKSIPAEFILYSTKQLWQLQHLPAPKKNIEFRARN